MDVDLRLYALLESAVAGGHTLADLAGRIADSATPVQLRDKQSSTRAMVEEAGALRSVLARAQIPLVINDRVDVALAARADDVHIGQDDMAPEDARTLLGRTAIIGLSIKTLRGAETAPLYLLDYVAVGGVYATTSKKTKSPPIGLAGLREVTQAVRKRTPKFPICAIGGIDSGNAGKVIDAGVDGVAVISAIAKGPNSGTAARKLREAVDRALERRGRE